MLTSTTSLVDLSRVVVASRRVEVKPMGKSKNVRGRGAPARTLADAVTTGSSSIGGASGDVANVPRILKGVSVASKNANELCVAVAYSVILNAFVLSPEFRMTAPAHTCES